MKHLMTRKEMTEQWRRIRAAENRDPVENAVMAIAALSPADRTAAIARFNSVYQDCKSVPTIIEKKKAGQ